MFALHWICALTLALVSCLCAQPVKRDLGPELLDHISNLISFNLPAKCPDNTTLNSPFDIKKECIFSALNCTITRLDDLIDKCNFSERDRDAIESVIVILEQQQTAPSESCSCENYKEKDVKTFLENMQHQMQQYNSLA